MQSPAAPPGILPDTLARWSVIHAMTCVVGASLTAYFWNPIWLVLAATGSFLLLIWVNAGSWTPESVFGPANWITLGRLFLVIALLFLPSTTLFGWILVGVSIAILVLDGVDGFIARKHRLESEFGEYLDKESDAFFMLVLCMTAYLQGRLDTWILAPGLLRYGFVLALFFARPGPQKEYRSNWARWIYVVTVSGLLSVFVLPPFIHLPVVIVVTTALFLSFAHYFRWLIRERVKLREHSSRSQVFWGIAAFLTLNSLLLIPSFLANLETSSFFPIPGSSGASSVLSWTRGWYDYFLYFFIRRPNQDLFRFCVDLGFLLTLFAFFPHRRKMPVWLSRLFFVLLLYEVYDAIAFSFFHRHGILYEDARYGLNLYYLLIDSISAKHAFRLIGLIVGVVVFVWCLPALFRKAHAAFSTRPLRQIARWAALLFWPFVLLIWFWFGFGDPRPTVRTISGKIAMNLVESHQLATTLAAAERLPVDSVYYSFETEPFTSRPNIVLFMVESYGRILRDSRQLRAGYDSLLQSMDSTFKDAGFVSATRTSIAPVSGGLSWLSMNSLLSGIFMQNRTFYTRYLHRIATYPHLVRMLQKEGYHTVTLQPPNRERPGLPLDNHYRFDTTIFFDDLNYEGLSYGIWIIPDQYSLEYAREHYLKHIEPPFFLFFETATTHAPWTDLPPYVSDWRSLNRRNEPAGKNENSLTGQLRASFNNRFYKSTPSASILYWQSIVYDLNVLSDYILNHAPENTLVMIVGDHQPPVLSSSSYETPFHVITRDRELMDRFVSFGFEPGMAVARQSSDSLTHAGIYSMLIDVLTAPADSLPTSRYRPSGVAPSVLIEDN